MTARVRFIADVRPLPLCRHWEQDLQSYLRLVREKVDVEDLQDGRDEVFPRHRMPVIRYDEACQLIVKPRHWGFIVMINGKSVDAEGRPKKVRRDVFNAMSEKLTSSFAWKWSFKERRCLIPMSSWDEWPGDAGRQATSAGLDAIRAGVRRGGPVRRQHRPKTGEKVPFIRCTVPLNEFMGTVHDRAPMVLLTSHYEAWLAGGAKALQLVGTHPVAEVFEVDFLCERITSPRDGWLRRPEVYAEFLLPAD